MSELNPQIKKSLKVNYSLKNILNDIVCISKNLNRKEKELILDITYNYYKLEKNDQVSTLFKSTSGEILKEDDFNGLKKFVEDYKKFVSHKLAFTEK